MITKMTTIKADGKNVHDDNKANNQQLHNHDQHQDQDHDHDHNHDHKETDAGDDNEDMVRVSKMTTTIMMTKKSMMRANPIIKL